jgi:hypothetical protein
VTALPVNDCGLGEVDFDVVGKVRGGGVVVVEQGSSGATAE